MNDRERDSLRARLRAGDPYGGEPMPGPAAARIRARMRAAALGARGRPYWIPAAAAAAMVTVVVLGVWQGTGRSHPEQASLPASPPAALTPPDENGVAESPGAEPTATMELPRVRPTGPADLAVTHPESALAAVAVDRLPAVAPPETAVTAPETMRTGVRRVQFTAPGGTRIVWALNPDFDPNMTRNGSPPARHQQGANGKW